MLFTLNDIVFDSNSVMLMQLLTNLGAKWEGIFHTC